MAGSANTPLIERSPYYQPGTGTTALPLLPRGEVQRPRLLNQMRSNPAARIWSIVAPAGYGKSVLAIQWASTLDMPIAWFSLGDNDNQAAQFWNRLCQAISRAIGKPILADRDMRAPIAARIPSLLKAIEELNRDLLLVFDDLHVIRNDEVVRELDLIFAGMPANLRILITSRTESQASLELQRAAGDVVDVTEQDLAFSDDESMSFFAGSEGPAITDEQITRITARAEGWVTAFALIKLSLRATPNASIERLLDRLGRGTGFIARYLVEEVVRPLPPELREFAIGASVLDDLDPELCNATLAIDNSASLIRQLEQQNSFVISYADDHTPPRFHHLFSEALCELLKDEREGGAINALHRRAATFLKARGDLDGAAHHAIASNDWDYAVEILNELCAELFSSEKTEILWYWLSQLPSAGLLAAGQLSSWLAWSMAVVGRRAEALSILDPLEPVWRANGETQLVGEAALARGYLAFYECDDAAFLAGSAEPVELIPDSDIVRKLQAWGFRGLALRLNGEREQAHHARRQALALVEKMPEQQSRWLVSADYTEPSWMAIEGRLDEALEYGNRLHSMVGYEISHDGLTLRGWNALVHLERNELDEAEAIATELARLPVAYWNPARFYVVLSRVAWARGEHERGMELIELALDHIRHQNNQMHIKSMEALRAWYWTDRGDHFLAQRWESINPIESMHWMRFFNQFHGGLTIARLAIETGNPARASRVCQYLLEESTRRQRWGEMVRLHVLHAVAQNVIGDSDGVTSSLSWAIRLGHHGRFVRSFLDDGKPIAPYLAQSNLIAMAPEFVREIHGLLTAAPGAAPISEEHEPDGNHLTYRQISILRLVSDGMSNLEIAQQLFIAEPTVRKHLNNVFQKLGATNRTQAVNLAREAGML